MLPPYAKAPISMMSVMMYQHQTHAKQFLEEDIILQELAPITVNDWDLVVRKVGIYTDMATRVLQRDRG